jgi:hypothetical protein
MGQVSPVVHRCGYGRGASATALARSQRRCGTVDLVAAARTQARAPPVPSRADVVLVEASPGVRQQARAIIPLTLSPRGPCRLATVLVSPSPPPSPRQPSPGGRGTRTELASVAAGLAVLGIAGRHSGRLRGWRTYSVSLPPPLSPQPSCRLVNRPVSSSPTQVASQGERSPSPRPLAGARVRDGGLTGTPADSVASLSGVRRARSSGPSQEHSHLRLRLEGGSFVALGAGKSSTPAVGAADAAPPPAGHRAYAGPDAPPRDELAVALADLRPPSEEWPSPLGPDDEAEFT